jgi:eukaryotic-like serine/threonine-protein kinase
MSAPQAVPSSIAHYNLLQRIGHAGLGEIYRARDTKVGRTVALRVIPSEFLMEIADRTAFRQSLTEAAALSHPNIATLFDFGEQGARFYIAYEFVSGMTLGKEMAGRAVNPRRALELAVQLSDALAEAHARDIVHGDLRPETIMVTGKGSAKILEFGISRWTRGGRARGAVAQSPDSIGSDAAGVAAYLSPEQALGNVIDPRSDLFSLGSIVYEMLTGRAPFAASSPATAVMNVIRMAPVRLSGINPTLPAELDTILTRALSKNLDERYQSAASLAAELRSVAAVLDVRSGESATPDLIPLDEEPRSSGWVVALILIAALVAAWWFWPRG